MTGPKIKYGLPPIELLGRVCVLYDKGMLFFGLSGGTASSPSGKRILFFVITGWMLELNPKNSLVLSLMLSKIDLLDGDCSSLIGLMVSTREVTQVV